jgi:hypothetical protein
VYLDFIAIPDNQDVSCANAIAELDLHITDDTIKWYGHGHGTARTHDPPD